MAPDRVPPYIIVNKSCLHVTAPKPGDNEMANPITHVSVENCLRSSGRSTPRHLTIPVSNSMATKAPTDTIHDQLLSFKLVLDCISIELFHEPFKAN